MGETEKAPTPDEQLRQLFGQAEKQTAGAVEHLVQGNAFGEILARATENVMGLTKIGFDVMDLVVRNLRIAGKPDITRLGRQLARNEDKLERVLQEVERLQDQLEEQGSSQQRKSSNGSSSSSRRRSSSSAKNGSSRSRSRSKSS